MAKAITVRKIAIFRGFELTLKFPIKKIEELRSQFLEFIFKEEGGPWHMSLYFSTEKGTHATVSTLYAL